MFSFLQAPLETHSHQQKASGFKTESCDSDEDEEQPRGMTSSASNGKPPWDIQVQRARQSAGRRTRGAVEYESPSASADSSTLMMRRMQKHPPSVEVSPSKEPIYGGTADLDGSLLSVKSDLGHAGGFMTPIDRSAMDKAMTPPSIGAMHPAMKHIGTSGPLTPKRTPGSLCYGDRGSSNSSGDSAGPLEECLSPTASLKVTSPPEPRAWRIFLSTLHC